jgi:hypothetical protein
LQGGPHGRPRRLPPAPQVRRPCLCECSETSCVEIVAFTNDEYERVRSRATVFVVVPGHERPEIENVVEANEGFMLVEKVVAVEEIIEADPRSDEPGAA